MYKRQNYYSTGQKKKTIKARHSQTSMYDASSEASINNSIIPYLVDKRICPEKQRRLRSTLDRLQSVKRQAMLRSAVQADKEGQEEPMEEAGEAKEAKETQEDIQEKAQREEKEKDDVDSVKQ